jgi:small subunit ribosomal protein S16
MSVKIRLQRHGKNLLLGWQQMLAQKRDGKYLEKIGTYNPNTNPATIDLNLDSAVDGCTMVLNQQILLKQFFLTGVY